LLPLLMLERAQHTASLLEDALAVVGQELV
jgi:hypothetical protein